MKISKIQFRKIVKEEILKEFEFDVKFSDLPNDVQLVLKKTKIDRSIKRITNINHKHFIKTERKSIDKKDMKVLLKSPKFLYVITNDYSYLTFIFEYS